MLRIDEITKAFAGKTALHPLTLDVEAGEIFGLLGHNGAGKSTTFGILLGQVHPDAGEVWIRGASVQRNRSQALGRVGAIFETPSFYDYLSGWRNLGIFTAYTGRVAPARMREIVELVGLTARIHDPVRVYSHGMRQRLALAQALLPDPEFIILDEPSEGLDPEGIQEMRELILRLRAEHRLTVLLSSHLLPEVEQLCDRIAILNQGRLVFAGAWRDALPPGRRVRLDIDDWERAGPVIERALGTRRDSVVTFPDGTDLAAVVAELVTAGVRLSAVEPVRVTLEDFYLERVNR